MIRMIALALMCVTTVNLRAQETPAPAPSRPPTADTSRPVPLKIQLVLSRYQGEKKLSSVPYTLSVTANEVSGNARVRMGVQVPVPSGSGGSYSYKDLGTNIDCSAMSGTDGHFKVLLTVTDSSVYFTDQEPSRTVPGVSGTPAFRTFNSTFTTWLRDGQSSTYTSVTDQIGGQVLKIDATLNVLK
jgi:hypothetical protein